MKETPFMSSDSDENTAELLLEQIYSTLRPPLLYTLKNNDPEPLRDTIELMKKAQEQVLAERKKDINSKAQITLDKLIDQTELVADLFDDDITSDTAYQQFHNKIISDFITEELGFSSDPAQVENDEYFLLYRRFFSDSDSSNPDVPGLAVIAWDKKKNVILPITFALHPAIQDDQGEQFVRTCMSTQGRDFISKRIIHFAKENEIVDRMREVDEATLEIEIMPQVILPMPQFCQRVLAEVQANENIENVFDELTPEQFN